MTWFSGNCYYAKNIKGDQVRLLTLFPRYFLSYTLYPEQLLSTFSNIGGLIALFNVSALLLFFHKKRFET
jgi:hypothetical protein